MRKPRSNRPESEDLEAIESPPLTEDELAALRPARDVMPDLVAAYRRTRGPQKAPTKVQTTLRLDRDVVEHFKASGPRWQSRINAALKEAVAREKRRRSPS